MSEVGEARDVVRGMSGAAQPATELRPAAARFARDDMLSAIEALIDPGALVLTLWCVALIVEGDLAPAYLILSIIAFSLTFPGTSRLQRPLIRMAADIAFGWAWIAGLLLLTGFATRYIREVSDAAVVT